MYQSISSSFSGHIYCRICKKENVCKVCKQTFVDSPNLALERIIRLISLPCKHRSISNYHYEYIIIIILYCNITNHSETWLFSVSAAVLRLFQPRRNWSMRSTVPTGQWPVSFKDMDVLRCSLSR